MATIQYYCIVVLLQGPQVLQDSGGLSSHIFLQWANMGYALSVKMFRYKLYANWHLPKCEQQNNAVQRNTAESGLMSLVVIPENSAFEDIRNSWLEEFCPVLFHTGAASPGCHGQQESP